MRDDRRPPRVDIRIDDATLEAVRPVSLCGGAEPCPAVHTLRAERERCGELTPIRDAARANVRSRQHLGALGLEHKVANIILARVPRALETVERYNVDAEALRFQRMPDGDAFICLGRG